MRTRLLLILAVFAAGASVGWLAASGRLAMLLDPAALFTAPGLIVAALGVVLVGKPVVALPLVWAMKYPFRTALTVALSWWVRLPPVSCLLWRRRPHTQ